MSTALLASSTPSDGASLDTELGLRTIPSGYFRRVEQLYNLAGQVVQAEVIVTTPARWRMGLESHDTSWEVAKDTGGLIIATRLTA